MVKYLLRSDIEEPGKQEYQIIRTHKVIKNLNVPRLKNL